MKTQNGNKFLSRTDVQFTAWVVTVVLAISIPFVTYGNKIDNIEKTAITNTDIIDHELKIKTLEIGCSNLKDEQEKQDKKNQEILDKLHMIELKMNETNSDIKHIKELVDSMSGYGD